MPTERLKHPFLCRADGGTEPLTSGHSLFWHYEWIATAAGVMRNKLSGDTSELMRHETNARDYRVMYSGRITDIPPDVLRDYQEIMAWLSDFHERRRCLILEAEQYLPAVDIAALDQKLPASGLGFLVNDDLWATLNELRRAANVARAASRLSEPAAERKLKVAGGGMPWKTAKKEAEAYCRHHLFPGVNALAAKIGCSPSTMRRAITESVILQGKQGAQLRGKTTIRAVALSGAVAGAIAQTREPAPADAVSEAIDSPFRRLLEQATPDERATLNAMTPDEQRKLVAMLQDDPDAAPKNAQDRRAGAPGRGAKTLQK